MIKNIVHSYLKSPKVLAPSKVPIVTTLLDKALYENLLRRLYSLLQVVKNFLNVNYFIFEIIL